jgi:hypothetical protein
MDRGNGWDPFLSTSLTKARGRDLRMDSGLRRNDIVVGVALLLSAVLEAVSFRRDRLVSTVTTRLVRLHVFRGWIARTSRAMTD